MTQLRPALYALPFAALLLAGCPIYGDGGHDPDPDPCRGDRCFDPDAGTAPASCTVDGDCEAGEACVDGTCSSAPSCTDDGDCATGEICDFRGTCVDDTPGTCRSNADCSGDDVCVEGSCRAPDTTCQFNYECGPGRACVDNTCTDICTDDADCGSGLVCEGSFCRPDTDECSTSSDCGSGESCVGGRCFAGCTDDTTCAEGEYCADDGFCRPDWRPQPFCVDDGDCASGHVCREGVCRTPCPSGTNDECRRFDSQLPICAEDMLCYSTNETSPECASADDCDPGDSCIDAICR